MNIWALVAMLFLLVINGLFVAAEFAYVASRPSRLKSLADGGDKRAMAAMEGLKETSMMLAAAQLGITMASLALGAIAEPALAHAIELAFEPLASIPEGLAHTLAFVIALTIVVFLHMVIGEMAPKNIAITEPERTLIAIRLPFSLFVLLLRPLILLLNAISNGGVRLLGIEPQNEMSEVRTAAQIRNLVTRAAGQGLLEETDRQLLSGAAAFSERDAASVMLSRTEMVALGIDTTPADIEQLVVETGHSRFPIYRNDLDDVIGFFHAKDLLKIPAARRRKPLERKWVRKVLVVPENRPIQSLLIDMRRGRMHFALVIDEYGGTSGIVTLEDVLEELVGDIHDEYDMLEAGIEEVSPGRYVVPGTMPLHEASDNLGFDLPEGPYETLAGFLMDRLGRIPKRRDAVEFEGWTMRVLAMHRRRVVQVLIERPQITEVEQG